MLRQHESGLSNTRPIHPLIGSKELNLRKSKSIGKINYLRFLCRDGDKVTYRSDGEVSFLYYNYILVVDTIPSIAPAEIIE